MNTEPGGTSPEQLAAMLELQEGILNSLPTGLAVCQQTESAGTMACVWTNRQASGLLGLIPTESQPNVSEFSVWRGTPILSLAARCVELKTAFHEPIQITLPNGVRRLLDCQLNPFRVQSGWRVLVALAEVATYQDADTSLAGESGRRLAVQAESDERDVVLAKQAELDGFFTAALDLLCIADLNGRFRRLNLCWSEVLGYSPQELVGQAFMDYVHPEDRAATEAALGELAHGMTVTGFVNRYRAKDGTYRSIEWRSVPCGELIYAAARDVTEHQAAAEELSRSRFMLRTILDSIPQRVFWKDRELRYRGCNRAFANDAGLNDPEEIAGKTDADLPWRDRAQAYQEDDAIVIETGAAKLNYEEAKLSPRGKQIWVRTTKFALRNHDGSVFGVLGTYEDITEHVNAQEQLRNLNIRFDLAAESAHIGVWDWDVGRDRLFWDERMFQLYGKDGWEFLGTQEGWMDALHPNDVDHCRQEVQRALQDDKDLDTEFRIQLPGGQVRYLKAHGRVVRDADGRARRMTGVNYDITERKQAEQAIHKSHRELRILYSISQSTSESLDLDVVLRHAQETIAELWDVAGTGVYLLSEDGKTLVLQSAIGLHPEYAQQIRNARVGEGIAGKSILGKVPLTLAVTDYPEGPIKQTLMALGYRTLASIPLSTARACIGAMQIALRHEKRFDAEELRLLQAVGQQLGTSIQNAQLYQSIARELDERTRIEAKLVEASRQAEAASVAKSEFLANMSHEIRTPMNAIVGFGHLVLQTDLSSKQREYLLGMNASAQSLLSILNHILDLSKIEAGMMVLERSDFCLQDSLQKVATLATVRSEGKSIELLVRVANEVPDGLVGDALRLEQVLFNLLGNAFKFTDQGYVFLDVDLVGTSGGAGTVDLRFSVADTGLGIAPDRIPSLFQPFTQTDNSTTRRFGGTGLGLSICKSLVELMQGKITVESTPGQGSSFSFTARFGRSELVEMTGVQQGMVGTGIRVLLADAEGLRRQILEGILVAHGAVVTIANTGREVVSAVHEAHRRGGAFDVIVLDRATPELDAVGVAEQLHHAEVSESLPLIVLVAATEDDWLRTHASDLGIVALLSKPVLPRVLWGALLDASRDARTLPPAPRGFGQVDSSAMARLAGVRVLLVEDQPLNQQIAQEILEQAGVCVDVVDNGLEAVERLSLGGGDYDVVLMDVQMPVMDGFEAARRIRSLWSAEDLPIIAMTAHAFTEERDKCLRSGMNDHIAKPINVNELYSRIATWVGAGTMSETLRPASAEGDATSMEPEAPDNSALALAGFDFQDGLGRVGGNVSFYRSLLVDYEKTVQSMLTDLRQAKESRNTKTMGELAHSLKGVSANVGARGVALAAGALEQAVKSGRDRDFDVAFTSLESEAIATLRSLESAVKPSGRPSPQSAGTRRRPKVAELAPLFRDLGEALSQRNLQALTPVERISELLSGTDWEGDSERLIAAVNGLDFSGALKHLGLLVDKLNMEMPDQK